jgi:NADH pyrophosphatase NudC (nudix superfamily)
LGFFAETSDEEITLADGELAEAVWLKPEELPPPPDAAGPLSLTATMIKAFAEQSVHF